jgi:hypothetical protein
MWGTLVDMYRLVVEYELVIEERNLKGAVLYVNNT